MLIRVNGVKIKINQEKGDDVVPRCLNCGNETSFISSSIQSGTPWMSTENSAVAAHFADGQVRHVENHGASHDIIDEAFQRPESYFDTCHQCGSTNLQWP